MLLMSKDFIIFTTLWLPVLGLTQDFKGFDDSILFGINWPGLNTDVELAIEDAKKVPDSDEKLLVKTHNKEQYECHIPTLSSQETSSDVDQTGPNPLQLLKPLFTQKICSYRLESYWGYEVCHGRYIRQYHEDREGKKVKLQEYYLGRWDKEQQDYWEKKHDPVAKPKTTKIDGINLPYLEIEMHGGTLCDLNGRPRLTRVQYVCYSHGKHEVYSLKETSSCEYEILILSPLLCAHPKYKPQESGENVIDCLPMGDAPKKPRSLLALEAESLKLQHQTVRLALNERDPAKDVVAVFKVEKYEKDGETRLRFELKPLDEVQEELSVKSDSAIDSSPATVPSTPPPIITDDGPVRAFLNGETCLYGGTGWWKYEFCYGKTVSQYHVDKNGEKTSLLLGKFDEQAHIAWIKNNKAKMPKPVEQRTSISHLYSGGDVCDKTGKPRQTEVKLKCLEGASSIAQVSLYLLEPKTCQYILGVESPLICEILPLADEHALVPQKSVPAATEDSGLGDD